MIWSSSESTPMVDYYEDRAMNINSSSGWVNIEGTFTVPPSAVIGSLKRLKFYTVNADNTFYVDDVVFAEASN